jgi:hypothetical protein
MWAWRSSFARFHGAVTHLLSNAAPYPWYISICALVVKLGNNQSPEPNKKIRQFRATFAY